MKLAYKAFNPDLTCISGGNCFQYKKGVWNHTTEANCGKNGFHCADNPLDCLTYYPIWEKAVYYIVFVEGDMHEDGYDSKISCTRMWLAKQLSMEEFIYCSLEYMVNHPYAKLSKKVYDENYRGTQNDQFAIIRGKNPCASGKIGTIIGLAKENIDSKSISDISVFRIDGKQFMPDTMYYIDGMPCFEKGIIL